MKHNLHGDIPKRSGTSRGTCGDGDSFRANESLYGPATLLGVYLLRP